LLLVVLSQLLGVLLLLLLAQSLLATHLLLRRWRLELHLLLLWGHRNGYHPKAHAPDIVWCCLGHEEGGDVRIRISCYTGNIPNKCGRRPWMNQKPLLLG
jgi:hypothetical protein